jgi:pimeloyl-ACP methyl ester carboxylesterase
VVAILKLRADESGALEHAVAAYLLSEGFNLAGLHVYEALLLARYLRSQPQVDGRRLSLLGHSGGAVLAGMLAFLDPGFSALVSDTNAVFSEDMDGGLLCSTSHLLYPHHPQLADLETLPAARLFEYGYPEGSAEVLRFLEGSAAASAEAVESAP